jgi:hypothetical protein
VCAAAISRRIPTGIHTSINISRLIYFAVITTPGYHTDPRDGSNLIKINSFKNNADIYVLVETNVRLLGRLYNDNYVIMPDSFRKDVFFYHFALDYVKYDLMGIWLHNELSLEVKRLIWCICLFLLNYKYSRTPLASNANVKRNVIAD